MNEAIKSTTVIKLLNEVKAGDTESFEQLYLQLKDRYIRILQKKFPAEMDYEGVYQDAMISILRYCHTFNGEDDGQGISWITRIIINKGYEEIRKIIRRPTDPIDSSIYLLPDESLESRVEEVSIAKATFDEIVNRINVNDQAVQCFLDLNYGSLSYMDVAKKYNIAIGTVKSRANRGRKKIHSTIIS